MGISLAGAAPALALTITVETPLDETTLDGDCSLRQAVAAANNPGPINDCTGSAVNDDIVLPAGTYTLGATGGDLDITSDLTITGAGSGTTIIDANSVDRLIEVTGGRTVSISGVTLTRGRAPNGGGVLGPGGSGGAILHTGGGSLTVANSVLDDNHAGDGAAPVGPGAGSNGGGGGAISKQGGTLTVTNTTLSHNEAGYGGPGNPAPPVAGSNGGSGGTAGNGGAIDAQNAAVTISGSAISLNRTRDGGAGGAASASPGSQAGGGGKGGQGGGVSAVATSGLPIVAITSTSITGNHAGNGAAGGTAGAGGHAGGIAATSVQLRLTDATVSGNAAGNGAVGQGLATPGSGSAGGDGGGIRQTTGWLTLERTTVSGNTAGAGAAAGGGGGKGGDGGGIWTLSADDQKIVNSTLSGNNAGAGGAGGTVVVLAAPGIGGKGGALFVGAGNTAIEHSTIASNSGGAGGATVALPAAPPVAPSAGAISGSATLKATIVSGNGAQSCTGSQTDGGVNFAFADASCPGDNIDPKLGALAGNGGPTLTHALLDGSPAIDAAGACVTPTTDQRGIARPQGGGCDSGAFEKAPPPPPAGGTTTNPGSGTQGLPDPQTPGGGNSTVAPDALRPTLRLTPRRQKLLAVVKKGYALDFTTSEGGTAVVEVFAAGKDATGLKLVAARTVRVARGSKRVASAGKARVVVKLTRKARARFRGRKSVKLVVRLTVTDAAGNAALATRTVVLKR
jgi:hypothetical protein